jgi:signal transduction histidine kinase
MFFLPGLHPAVRLLYFGIQASVILYLVSIHPEYDFTALLFVLLVYQAASWYTGKMRWALVVLLVVLTPGSLMFFLGMLRGLSLGFLYVALEIVLAGFTVAFQEMESARAESQVMLAELKETNHQLELYATQVEELAAIDERNRLARELHDSISQTLFSIALTTQAAQMLLKRDPGRAKVQLEKLHELTQSALTSMRDLITQLRPKET